MVKNLPVMQETQAQSRVGKIPWRRAWQPIPVFLPGESHGQRGLGGCSPRGHRVRHNWVIHIFTFMATFLINKWWLTPGLESMFYLTCSFHPSYRGAWRAELRRWAGESFMIISNVSMRWDGRSNDIHGTYLLSLCARLLDDQPVPSWRQNYNGEDPIPPVTTSLSTNNIIQQSLPTFYNIATSYQVSSVPTCALSPWEAFYKEYPCILIPEDAIKRRAFDLTFWKCCMLNIANIFIEELLSIHHVTNFALRVLHVSVKLILTVIFSWCPFYR